jgi:tetratricopeptide (TPR) repeat protein
VRTILATLLTVLLLLPVSAVGEIQTITHTVKQSFGGSQSADDARISAVAKAKREALEKAGTYIESITVVKNLQVDKDEILALAAGVLKAEVVSQKNYHTDDAFGIDVVVKVVVDTSVLEERVKKLLQDRTHLDQLKQVRAREKELLEKIVILEEENRKKGKSKQKAATLKKEFQAAAWGLTAFDWLQKAILLWTDGKFADSRKAMEYLNEAIRLKPDLAHAYSTRGIAYYTMGQYQRAIKDYDEAIRLKLNIYAVRGIAYREMGQYQRAIKDFDEAIRLKPDLPDLANAYSERGVAYNSLRQHERAIKDCDEAIRLKPNLAEAYFNRGSAYHDLGQHEEAIKDYDEAIRLKPNFAEAYLDRGGDYFKMGRGQQAIKDFGEAIRLKPGFAEAYFNRGFAYFEEGQNQQAIKDFDETIRLKPDFTTAYMNRGIAFFKMEKNEQAIKDFNEALRLEPGLAEAYSRRGITYIVSGNNKEGCHSLIKACDLGHCTDYEYTKQKGYCQ